MVMSFCVCVCVVYQCVPALCLCFHLHIFQTLTTEKRDIFITEGRESGERWRQGGSPSHTRPISAE